MPILNNLTVNKIGGGGSSDKYPLLSRVTDDSNQEIGTVVCHYNDSNNHSVAVVVLDAKDRLFGGLGSTDVTTVTGVALWQCLLASPYNDPNNSLVSTVNQITYTIDGTSYAAQIPTMAELVQILSRIPTLNSLDTTAATYPDKVLGLTSYNYNDAIINYYGIVLYDGSKPWAIHCNIAKTVSNGGTLFFVPVLEIPNE